MHSCNKKLMLEQDPQTHAGIVCPKCAIMKKENTELNFTLNETDKKWLETEKENGNLQKKLDRMTRELQSNV